MYVCVPDYSNSQDVSEKGLMMQSEAATQTDTDATQADISAMKADISAMKAAIAVMKDKGAQDQKTANRFQANYGNTVDVLQHTTASLQCRMGGVEQQLPELAGRVANSEALLATHAQWLSAGDDKRHELAALLAAHKESLECVSKIVEKLNELPAVVAALKGRVYEAEQQLRAGETRDSAQMHDLATMRGELTYNTERVCTLHEKYDNCQKLYKGLAADLNYLGDRFTGMQKFVKKNVMDPTSQDAMIMRVYNCEELYNMLIDELKNLDGRFTGMHEKLRERARDPRDRASVAAAAAAAASP